jgi:Mrp family chromosome partitioning ATPase/predicted Fe-Mo cluster-binding NifX family protein
MAKVVHKIVVLSGKGGVGKSTVSVNLAVALAKTGKKVGLLDVDLHGPSVPAMLGLEGRMLDGDDNGMFPVELPHLGNLKIISTGFLLEESDSPVIWRGPMKSGVIRQFLSETVWGELDYLVVDCPPGTGDEPLSVIQMLGASSSALIVTTPQAVSSIDVSKSINFCRKLSLPVLGIVENMSGFVCPGCGKTTHIFLSGGGKRLAEEYAIPFLGSIPIDPAVSASGDSGEPYISRFEKSEISRIFESIVNTVAGSGAASAAEADKKTNERSNSMNIMKIAVPTADGILNRHFGHCDNIRIFEVNEQEKKIVSSADVTPPPHEPGLLPRWLGEKSVNLVIAGGMGSRAQQLFEEQGIKVITGAPSETAEKLVADFFAGTLVTGANSCDH